MKNNSQVQYSRIATQELTSVINDNESQAVQVEEGLNQLKRDRLDNSILHNSNLPSSSISISGEREDGEEGDNENGRSSNAKKAKDCRIQSSRLFSENQNNSQLNTLGNDIPNAFSRRPSKPRDIIYALLFILHFFLISVLTGTEDLELHDSFNEWSTMVTIITILSSILGSVLVVLLASDSMREPFLSHGIPLSIIFEVCLGNILLLTNSRYSVIGVVILAVAFIDGLSIQASKENVTFTLALLGMVTDILKPYGIYLVIVCACILIAHTALLMWWGILFVGLITKDPSGLSEVLIIMMAVSLYWTTQFFHALMSYIVGGCVMWYFIRGNEVMEPRERVLLHVKCALTSSLGSICKAGVFSPLAQIILSLDHWAIGRPQSFVSVYSARGCGE